MKKSPEVSLDCEIKTPPYQNAVAYEKIGTL